MCEALPVVTLLKPRKVTDTPRESFGVREGDKLYEFFMGLPMECSKEVAERCEQFQEPNGRPIFEVKYPEIADHARRYGYQTVL